MQHNKGRRTLAHALVPRGTCGVQTLSRLPQPAHRQARVVSLEPDAQQMTGARPAPHERRGLSIYMYDEAVPVVSSRQIGLALPTFVVTCLCLHAPFSGEHEPSKPNHHVIGESCSAGHDGHETCLRSSLRQKTHHGQDTRLRQSRPTSPSCLVEGVWRIEANSDRFKGFPQSDEQDRRCSPAYEPTTADFARMTSHSAVATCVASKSAASLAGNVNCPISAAGARLSAAGPPGTSWDVMPL